jgi:hypothetical protein
MSGTLVPICSYVYEGDSNTCANARNLVFFAWNFKLVFALVTDSYRPFGLRRKPWMLFGLGCVLILLALLTAFADKLSASSWLGSLLVMQLFLMFSDVPADGQ